MNNDWNTVANWRPNTVPRRPSDVATFDVSNVTGLPISGAMDKVDHLAFTPSASAFTFRVGPDLNTTLTLNRGRHH